jgi:6-phosphogluconate dehydrogenase
MQLGMIGLGRMGGNMVRRLLAAGHQCVVFDQNPAAIRPLVEAGALGAASIDELVDGLAPPRAIWIMLPAGDPTEATVSALLARLAPDDTIIDGGNCYFKDDVRRAQLAADKRIHYLDVGVSGGIWGLERGYCMMIGGPQAVADRLDPIFQSLAFLPQGVAHTPGRAKTGDTVERGYVYCGPSGAGHFVKMVHNGIEYGVMQAYAEGFDILAKAASDSLPEEHRYQLKLDDIAEVWRRGSVISSWLLDLLARAMADDAALSNYVGYVQDSGEGRWTVQAALEEAVPADVLATSLFVRFRSRETHTFAEKVLSAMRHQFGGHVERPAGG